MTGEIKDVLLLSAVNASIAFTVAETKLFLSLRRWMTRKAIYLGKLFSCGYCFGHWIAFVLVAIYHPRLFFCWPPLDYFLTAIVIAWISAAQWAVMCWLVDMAERDKKTTAGREEN